MTSLVFGHRLFIPVEQYLPWKTNSRFDSASVDLSLKIGFQVYACVGPAFGLARHPASQRNPVDMVRPCVGSWSLVFSTMRLSGRPRAWLVRFIAERCARMIRRFTGLVSMKTPLISVQVHRLG